MESNMDKKLMRAFCRKFLHYYDEMYSGRIEDCPDYYVSRGDRLRTEKRDFAADFALYRNDLLTSDREVAAFAMAYEDMFEKEQPVRPVRGGYNVTFRIDSLLNGHGKFCIVCTTEDEAHDAASDICSLHGCRYLKINRCGRVGAGTKVLTYERYKKDYTWM